MKRGAKKAPAKKKKPELSFEEALERLEDIVHRLEEGEIPLEESIQAYAEGTQLVRRCLEKLESAESMIKELTEGTEGFRLEPSSLEAEDDDEEEDDEDDGEEDDATKDTGELPF